MSKRNRTSPARLARGLGAVARRLPIAGFAVAFALSFAGTRVAIAQDVSAIALDRYEPTPAGDAFFAVPDPVVPFQLRPTAGLVASYARSPLQLSRKSNESTEELGPVVSHQLTMHLLVGWDLLRTMKLDVDVPFTASQAGDSPVAPEGPIASPDGAVMNDVRAGARVAVVRQRRLRPAVAIAVNAWIPTGNDAAFAGTGELRYGGFVLAGADYRHLAWRAMVGRRRNDAHEGWYGLGSDITFGAALAYRESGLQVGPEVVGFTEAGDRSDAFTSGATGVEALLGARYRVGPMLLGAAGGPGFFKSAGTPAWRVLGTIQFAPEEDGSGLFRVESPDGPNGEGGSLGPGSPRPALPSTIAVATVDRDGDGVLDAEDVCPDLAGDGSPNAPKRGCPPDRDNDGVLDVDDRCPDTVGVRSAEAALNGCPADSDRDGIPDGSDACPNEAGARNTDPARNGCPTAVRVTGSQIVVTQNVNFTLGKADLEPASEPILAQVSQVLREHPEVVRVAVDGHTDNRGTDASNLDLSRRRAITVVRWLVSHGIDERRLEARGFGARRPVAGNDTPEGQARNRRVEFQILKRDPRGDAAWKDGAVHE